MSSSGSWRFRRPQLAQTLEHWRESDHPPRSLQVRVGEALVDLITDPLSWGREDPHSPGVFVRMLHAGSGDRVGFIYTVDPAVHEIVLVEVWTEP